MHKFFLLLITLFFLISCNNFQPHYFACNGTYVDAWKPCNFSSIDGTSECLYPTDTRLMTLTIDGDEVRLEGNGLNSQLKVCDKTDTHIKFEAYNGLPNCQSKTDLSHQFGTYSIHTRELDWKLNIGGRYVEFSGICSLSKI